MVPSQTPLPHTLQPFNLPFSHITTSKDGHSHSQNRCTATNLPNLPNVYPNLLRHQPPQQTFPQYHNYLLTYCIYCLLRSSWDSWDSLSRSPTSTDGMSQPIGINIGNIGNMGHPSPTQSIVYIPSAIHALLLPLDLNPLRTNGKKAIGDDRMTPATKVSREQGNTLRITCNSFDVNRIIIHAPPNEDNRHTRIVVLMDADGQVKVETL